MKFKELIDGSTFQVEEDAKAGMDVTYLKTLEDDGDYNAVRIDNSNIGIYIADDVRVITV